MTYVVMGFTLLVLIMMVKCPDIFFKAIDKIDAKIRYWIERILE